jgi:hypothetical protein
MKSNRLLGAVVLGGALAAAIVGCGSDPTAAVCCTEFKVGATIEGDIGGSAESKVAVQAVADFSGIAAGALDDLTTACRSMAQDLDAPQADQDKAEANTDRRARMNAWCQLAVTAIGTAKGQAQGTLTVDFVPPVCEASISAKANCQASCSGQASCDLKANPPQCTGGKLEVACKGECTAKAGATLTCTGKCGGECTGSCDAQQGGVQCAGRCDGTCKGAAQGGIGTGSKADGTCDGTCEGKCEATAPHATCSGTCSGSCSASCTGTAQASVKCDGECKADYEPLSCSGGTLEGGCKVEAKCESNCDASVRAKAECHPPEVKVSFTGAANVDAAGKLQATLEANLGVVLAFEARLKSMVEISSNLVGNINAVTDIKVACIPPVAAAVANAVQDVQASFSVAGSIVTAAK